LHIHKKSLLNEDIMAFIVASFIEEKPVIRKMEGIIGYSLLF